MYSYFISHDGYLFRSLNFNDFKQWEWYLLVDKKWEYIRSSKSQHEHVLTYKKDLDEETAFEYIMVCGGLNNNLNNIDKINSTSLKEMFYYE